MYSLDPKESSLQISQSIRGGGRGVLEYQITHIQATSCIHDMIFFLVILYFAFLPTILPDGGSWPFHRVFLLKLCTEKGNMISNQQPYITYSNKITLILQTKLKFVSLFFSVEVLLSELRITSCQLLVHVSHTLPESLHIGKSGKDLFTSFQWYSLLKIIEICSDLLLCL